MIKLNAGFSRKVGEPDYGSRGASVNLELEVESNLVNEPSALLERVRRLFSLARQAVDDELAQRSTAQNGDPPSREPARPSTPVQSNGARRSATASQLRAIEAIARRIGVDAQRAAQDAFGAELDRLTLRQASELIDQLKAQPSNGNTR